MATKGDKFHALVEVLKTKKDLPTLIIVEGEKYTLVPKTKRR